MVACSIVVFEGTLDREEAKRDTHQITVIQKFKFQPEASDDTSRLARLR
jgi:hypothetical protein